jgi:prepilin-type N-terminal cleavage/methylation domain-containing protein
MKRNNLTTYSHNHLITCSRGYTLIELSIVAAILGILTALGPDIILSINRLFFLSRAKIETQQNLRANHSLINRFLRQASENSIIIDKASGQPPYSRITFTKIQGDVMKFYQNNNELIMSENGVERVLASNLRYLAFSFPRSDNLSIVSVSMSMETKTYQGMSKSLQMSTEKVRVMNE